VAVLFGAMIMAAVFILLQNRRRAVYLVFGYEILLLLGCTLALFFMITGMRRSTIGYYTEIVSSDAQGIFDGYGLMNLSSEELYDTDEYEIITDRLDRRASSSALDVEDILIADTLTGRIVMSISGNNRDSIGNIYGNEVEKMLESISAGNAYTYGNVPIAGSRKLVLATNLSSSGYSGYSAVVIADDRFTFDGLFKRYKELFVVALSVFGVGTIAGLLYILLQSRDLRQFQQALKIVATTGEEIEKPEVIGRDINYMWNSLAEIRKSIVSSNRIK
jgi:hypothetical protein